MEQLGIETVKFVKGLSPAADRWNTGPSTDIVSMKNAEKLIALITQEGGTTGCAAVTVEACSDVSATGAVAIAFRYRAGASGAGAGGDLMGANTAATSTGFVTTAAADAQYLIEVKASELPAGKPFVRVKCTESVNDPVNGCVSLMLVGNRYVGAVPPTAIA